MRRLFYVLAILFMGVSTQPTHAATSASEFVRTANYFLMSGPVLDDALSTLATFDLIVIPSEAQVYNESFFSEIRSINNDIVILAYVPTVSWNDLYWTDPLHKQMEHHLESDWWLKDGDGNQVSVWPNTRALNLNTDWIEFLPEFVLDEMLSTDLWDGIFYDEVQDSISWVGATDVNTDGSADSASVADDLWANRYEELFSNTRNLVGDDYVVITNGSSNPDFAQHTNGRMFETFPSSGNSLSYWKDMMRQYVSMEELSDTPSVQVLNVNTENTGVSNDYQKVRFGLTSTLLGDGYFSFDHGTADHSQLWTYDEYDVYLGAPKSTLQNVYNPQQTSIDTGVWMREFEEGQVIVNATGSTQTIQLDGDFEKLHGTQDPDVNDGRIVSEVTIDSQDGVILLRPVDEILNATYLNGAFARVYNLAGETERTGFFAYDSSQRGGTQVIRYDLDSDGLYETIGADDTYFYIFDSEGVLMHQIAPYTDTYDQGINISVGDIEDDGSVEIVTGTENGGGPHVRVFNADGALINPGFFAYADSFRGGVNVSIGDLNGDGIKEIICGAGVNGGPHVRVFKKDGTLINPGFFAYDESFRGGVNVSVADVTGDGIDDIVTGPGDGGSPLARVYDRDGNMYSEFYIFDPSERDGLEVVASDLDGDGIAEILGLTTDVFTLSLF
ncbi:MAG: putative glycoside hydrolase [bacterium]|jgi:hypothetical protein|nr:putative glycoside hydrolase [bacterium]